MNFKPWREQNDKHRIEDDELEKVRHQYPFVGHEDPEDMGERHQNGEDVAYNLEYDGDFVEGHVIIEAWPEHQNVDD